MIGISSSRRILAAAAVGLGALAAVPAAQARTDVVLSIGLPGYGYGYAQPAPVYVQPSPVYVRPAPVYVQPQPYYVAPAGYYHHHRHHRHWNGRGYDRDHDGVPNRWDRRPNNPYRY